MGFSGRVNGTTKNPGFLDFGFCQCTNGPNDVYYAQAQSAHYVFHIHIGSGHHVIKKLNKIVSAEL